MMPRLGFAYFWKLGKSKANIFSQMVVKNGDESHGTKYKHIQDTIYIYPMKISAWKIIHFLLKRHLAFFGGWNSEFVSFCDELRIDIKEAIHHQSTLGEHLIPLLGGWAPKDL